MCAIFDICYIKEAYNENYNVTSYGFLSIGTLIEHCSENDFQILSQFVPGIFTALESTLNPSNFESKNKMYDFQVYISNLIIALSSYGYVSLSPENGAKLYEYYSKILIERQSLFDEALLAIPSLMKMMPSGKEQILDNFMTYLIFGLQSKEAASICKYSLMAISELLPQNLPNLDKHFDKIMAATLDIINYPESAVELRVQVISLYSDIFFNFKQSYIQYYDQTLSVVINAIKFSNDYDENSDESYLQGLNLAILEYLECSIRHLVGINKKNDFFKYLNEVMTFIRLCSSNTRKLSLDMAISCGGIIGDLCGIYGYQMNDYLSPESLNNICYVLRKDRNKGIQLSGYLDHVATALKLNKSLI